MVVAAAEQTWVESQLHHSLCFHLCSPKAEPEDAFFLSYYRSVLGGLLRSLTGCVSELPCWGEKQGRVHPSALFRPWTLTPMCFQAARVRPQWVRVGIPHCGFKDGPAGSSKKHCHVCSQSLQGTGHCRSRWSKKWDREGLKSTLRCPTLHDLGQISYLL